MIEKLIKPTVLIRKQQVLKNIERMAAKATKSGCDFRPHFKTHQSAEIGEWFRRFGVEKIAVSSLDMASYFANHGWSDISICVPVNLRQIERLDALAAQVTLHLLVESLDAVWYLEKHLKNSINLWIEIDTGYHRTGVDYSDFKRLSKILDIIQQNPHLHFQGILTHSGHTYQSRTTDQIVEIYNDTLKKMKEVKQTIESKHTGLCSISIGDTPGCSVIDKFDSAIDEIRPGNFVFFDMMQAIIGSCSEPEISLGVACPVIAKYPDRNEMVIYGGAIHLSKEAIPLENGLTSYGLVCPISEKGWGPSFPGVYVKELTQEHGKISATQKVMDSVQIGDLVIILPVHSCLTANLFRSLNTVEGEEISCFRM